MKPATSQSFILSASWSLCCAHSPNSNPVCIQTNSVLLDMQDRPQRPSARVLGLIGVQPSLTAREKRERHGGLEGRPALAALAGAAQLWLSIRSGCTQTTVIKLTNHALHAGSGRLRILRYPSRLSGLNCSFSASQLYCFVWLPVLGNIFLVFLYLFCIL